jgi:hypothetical protein
VDGVLETSRHGVHLLDQVGHRHSAAPHCEQPRAGVLRDWRDATGQDQLVPLVGDPQGVHRVPRVGAMGGGQLPCRRRVSIADQASALIVEIAEESPARALRHERGRERLELGLVRWMTVAIDAQEEQDRRTALMARRRYGRGRRWAS